MEAGDGGCGEAGEVCGGGPSVAAYAGRATRAAGFFEAHREGASLLRNLEGKVQLFRGELSFSAFQILIITERISALG